MNNTIVFVFAVRDRIERIMSIGLPFRVIVTSKKELWKIAGMDRQVDFSDAGSQNFCNLPDGRPEAFALGS
jgi:hypothetical protein